MVNISFSSNLRNICKKKAILSIDANIKMLDVAGITYSADCYAYCVMAHLLWPTRSEQYFLLAQGADNGDELDEFNEAPHVLNNYVEPSEDKVIA